MMTKQQKIESISLEIENLQLQMQEELIALANKKSIFLTKKAKQNKEDNIIDFYAKEIAKKQVDIDDLSEE